MLESKGEPVPPPPPPPVPVVELTVKETAPLVPAEFDTVTLWPPALALEATVKVALICVLLTTVTPDAVTPEGPILSVTGATKFVPVRVIGVLLDCEADEGLIDVNVGEGCATVKLTVPLVPLDVITLTLWPPSVATLVILKVALIWVLLTTDTPLAVTPEPAMLTVTGATKLVPFSVTGTLAPRKPDVGLTEVKVGAGWATVKVTEPLVPFAVITLTL